MEADTPIIGGPNFGSLAQVSAYWHSGPNHDTNHPIVIAFAGYIGAGKDTAAANLVEFVGGAKYLTDMGVRLVSTSFAKPVKEVLKMVYNLDDNDVYGYEDRRARERPHGNMAGMSPRRAMQLIATEGFRDLIDYDTWVKHWYRNCYQKAGPLDILYLTDFRFKNEYRFMREHCPNLIVYYIHRQDKSRLQRFIDRFDVLNISRRRSHESELQIDQMRRGEAVDDWNWKMLHNSGSLSDFATGCRQRFEDDLLWRYDLGDSARPTYQELG